MSNLKVESEADQTSDHKLSVANKFLLAGVLTTITSFAMAMVSITGQAAVEQAAEEPQMTFPIMVYKFSTALCNAYNFMVHNVVQPYAENVAKAVEVTPHKEYKALFALSALALTASICNGCIQNRRNKSKPNDPA